MNISDALTAYRTYARAEGKSLKTIDWVVSSVGYFSDFLGPDKAHEHCLHQSKRPAPFYHRLKQVGEEMPRKKPEKEVERVLFTFAETQEFLRVGHQTLYKLMKEGLPSHKIGKKGCS